MRHRKKFNHLGRKSAHRKSMIANMASSLILHKRINTTLAKAKALRTYVEPLITRSKEDTTHSRRMVFRVLRNKEAVTELFREVSVKVAERPGGYTRIIKLGTRLGDNAEMAMIELVDFNQNLLGDKVADKGKSTRRGRRGAGKKTEGTAEATATMKTKEKPADPIKDEKPEEAVAEVAVAEESVADVAEDIVVEEAAAEEIVADVIEEIVADEAVVEEIVAEVVEEPAAGDDTETLAQAEEQPEEGEPEPEPDNTEEPKA